MKTIWLNNPLFVIDEVINKLYPKVTDSVEVQFVSKEYFNEKAVGETIFPYSEKELVLINIDSSLSIEEAITVLIHEYAHFISGVKAEHNKVWKSTFKKILKATVKAVNSKK